MQKKKLVKTTESTRPAESPQKTESPHRKRLTFLSMLLLCLLLFAQTAAADVGGICAEGVDTFSHTYTLTGNGPSDMVAIAVAQKGRDGWSLSYHPDWGGWCAAFINDCAYLANQSSAIPFRSGATHDVGLLRQYILNSGGSVVSSPQKGDIVFYHDGSRYFHVGLMMDSSNTIQGNVNQVVYQMSSPRALDGNYSVSYVRPAYVNNAKGVLDVNGLLDGEKKGGLGEFGTCDVYINGSLVANDVSDYFTEHASGTTYRVTDIRAKDGYCYQGMQSSYSGTITSGNTADVRLSFVSCRLDVRGYLDSRLLDDLGGYGTFDLYINNSLAADDASDYNALAPYGASYRIEDIKAADGHAYDGVHAGSLSGTIGAGRTTVTLSFYTIGELSGDWIETDILPGNVNSEICEIQVKNHYRKNAAASPGEGWVKTGTGATTYVNTGGVYESDKELPTSNTRVYVGAYYYHYCGASTGVNVEHYNDGTHTDHHVAGDINAFYVSGGPWKDDLDPSYLAYQIRWKDGQWKDGLATCAAGRSAIWYRMYQYQDRVAVTNYIWEKDSDWTTQKDTAADSVRYRYRLRDTEDPVILSAAVTAVTPKDYTVTCQVADDSGIKKVQFITWTDTETESGAVTQEITPKEIQAAETQGQNEGDSTGDNTVLVSAVIPISAHGNEKDTWYHTKIVAEDVAGHTAEYAADAYTRAYIPTLVRSARKLTLPAGLTEIEAEAFEGDMGFGEVRLPDGAESIGSRAFADCARLSMVYLPDSVTEIAADAFAGSGNVVFLCESDNAAAAYARENEIPYLTGGFSL